MGKLITVIVPAYRVEKYIDKCLKSVVNQTYTDLEILIVDDGSDDDVSLICDYWSSQDKRITIVHKKNGGLSDARNYGIDFASGDYIGFVDSDDYIESDMYEILVQNIERYEADVSCCRYANIYVDADREPVGDDHSIHIYDGIDGLKEYLYGKVVDPFVCNKLYQAYSIQNKLDRAYYIRFIKGIQGEDIPFNVDIFEKINRIVVAGESKYNYTQNRPGAITSEMVSQKRISSVFYWETIRQKCHAKYPQIEKYALRRQTIFYIGLYNRIYNSCIYKEEKKIIIDFLRKHRKEILKSEISEKIIQISVLLITVAPWLYGYGMRMYKALIGSAERINT